MALFLLMTFLLLCITGSASAETAAPGWELTARTYPTNLPPSVNAVQRVAVTATSGTFTLRFEEKTTVAIPFNAEASVVQSDLQALPTIGAGNVVVKGGPGGYEVVFSGRLGARELPTLEANGAELNGGTVSVTVQAQGVGGSIVIDVSNVGAAASSGPVTVTDALPPGVTAIDAGNPLKAIGFGEFAVGEIGHSLWHCTGPDGAPRVVGARVITCTNDPVGMGVLLGGAGPRAHLPAHEGEIDEGGPAQLEIAVNVEPGAPAAGVNRAAIAGGGALTAASIADPVTVSSTPSAFAIVNWDGWFSNADGTLDTQAGSHPYSATFNIDYSNYQNPAIGNGFHPSGGAHRNLEVRLPPGFVGDPTAVPQCTRQELDSKALGGCPVASQVGFLVSILAGGSIEQPLALFNMVPPPGVPAEFAVNREGIVSFLDSRVRTGGDYGITTQTNNVPQSREIVSETVTLWGVPADPSHDRWRGTVLSCTENCSERVPLKPFLTLPTSCAAPQESGVFSIHATTWENASTAEKAFKWHDSNGNETGITGCENLAFGPTITTEPDTAKADTPAGLTVRVTPPLGGLQDPSGLGTSDIQNTTVTLPEGFVINPGQAAGLQACQLSQAHVGDGNDGPAECPNASKVGTVKAKTPLLEGAAERELKGNVYVLQSNPPHLKLLAAFSADGVNVKLVLNVELDEQTGRLTTRVVNIPEFPVSEFELSFSGGPQAALDTPTKCGSYTTSSDFTPWSNAPGSSQNFLSDAFPTAQFSIAEGPGGGPCPSSPMPFAPSMVAGSTTDQAGGFTNFSLLLQRGDGQQRIEKLQFIEPAGLAGLISSVPLCPEPQASQGTCSSASHIGHAVVTSGPGPYPLVLPQPGAPELPIYLTGPYKGAPFGLAIVTPVIAGPFNLGTIVTRAKIEVDPRTAQITITTDPLPQVVAGVPTDLRSINSIIDRPNFLFNPTNCSPQEFTGTAWGTPPPGVGGPGATAAISSHFGVGSCRELGFQPKVSVVTGAKSSKLNGASLFFNIVYPKGALGSQSWFNEAKFALPKQLPARLTTIQKACLASVFEANPAACPPASLIGHAVVHTQVLPVPLSGPVYFVSHGGAKFPDAVIVLQGDGVTVDLVGETFIDGRTGITSATFRNTPDVPFENIEVTIPSGPFSEFGANLPAKAHGSFCGQKLVMPTLFKAQNGLEIHQNTKVGITGCPKAKKAKKAKRSHRAARHTRKRG